MPPPSIGLWVEVVTLGVLFSEESMVPCEKHLSHGFYYSNFL